jgi:hypothetical protein
MKRRFGGFVGIVLLVAASLSISLVSGATAEVEIEKLSEVFDKFTVGGEVNVFYRYDQNPRFGAEVWDDKNTSYGETFSRIRFTAEKEIGFGTLTGQLAPYYAETIGRDVYGLVENEGKVGLDQAWIKFSQMFGSPLDLTVGRQDIKIEKWFVVGDGADQGVANWLYLHSSFPLAARLDGEFGPLKTTLFWAQAGDYVKYFWDPAIDEDTAPVENNVQLYGLNLHWDITENIFIYGGLYQKDEEPADSGGLGTEHDTLVYDIGFDATFGGLQLEGEMALQRGSAGDRDRNALGYFGAATYTFPIDLKPYVRGTFIHFSGDDNPGEGDLKEYDPMFFDFKAWNRWIVGELVGETQLPNSNKEALIAEIGFTPVEPVTIALMYIQHRLVEKNFLGGPVDSTDWADEINLMFDIPIGDHLFVNTTLGYVMPGDAAKEVFGNDENAFFAHVWLNFYF